MPTAIPPIPSIRRRVLKALAAVQERPGEEAADAALSLDSSESDPPLSPLQPPSLLGVSYTDGSRFQALGSAGKYSAEPVDNYIHRAVDTQKY